MHSSKIEKFFNDYTGKNPEILKNFYAENVSFVDPLGSIEGLSGLTRYYTNMYKGVKTIKFIFKNINASNNDYYAEWTMIYSTDALKSGSEIKMDGLSHIRFNDQGLVIYHRDYFDMGAMVYEHVPVLGGAIRYIRKRLHD